MSHTTSAKSGLQSLRRAACSPPSLRERCGAGPLVACTCGACVAQLSLRVFFVHETVRGRFSSYTAVPSSGCVQRTRWSSQCSLLAAPGTTLHKTAPRSAASPAFLGKAPLQRQATQKLQLQHAVSRVLVQLIQKDPPSEAPMSMPARLCSHQGGTLSSHAISLGCGAIENTKPPARPFRNLALFTRHSTPLPPVARKASVPLPKSRKKSILLSKTYNVERQTS